MSDHQSDETEGQDALKGEDIESGIGQDETNEQQSDEKVTSGATEPNPGTDSPEVGGP